MGRRIAIALLCGVLGYVAGAFGGGVVVSTFSSNTHDRALEAAMTGAFVFGPIAAVFASIAGFVLGAKRMRP
jgi:hypothetical protein